MNKLDLTLPFNYSGDDVEVLQAFQNLTQMKKEIVAAALAEDVARVGGDELGVRRQRNVLRELEALFTDEKKAILGLFADLETHDD